MTIRPLLVEVFRSPSLPRRTGCPIIRARSHLVLVSGSFSRPSMTSTPLPSPRKSKLRRLATYTSQRTKAHISLNRLSPFTPPPRRHKIS